MSPRRRVTRRSAKSRRWSADVTRRSNAMDLEPAVFKKKSSRAIALSLKRSVERSRRRKAAPFASAMSMLNLYINRAGRSLAKTDKVRLNAAKQELRRLFGRAESAPRSRRRPGGR